jgi:hypothetical protein
MIDLILLLLINITSALGLYWVIRVIYDSPTNAIRITFLILITIMIISIVLVNYMVLDLHYHY